MEPPVYVEGFQQRLRHWYTATNGDAVHRFPIRSAEIWNQYAAIPDTPDAGLINDGDTAGVVELRKALPLVLLSGGGEAPTKFQLAAAPADMSQVITATMGLNAPVAGSAAPTLLNAPADGYTPVIEDVAGNVFPMQASVWIVDGLNHFVEFPRGVPAEMAPPFTLTFFRYVGITGGAQSADPVWHYVADVTDTTLAPSPTGAGAVNDADFAAPLTGVVSPSTEGAGTKIVFVSPQGSFRAGTVSGAQWDAASRGLASFAAGTDGTVQGAASAIVGGDTNTLGGSQFASALIGGSGWVAQPGPDNGFAFLPRVRTAGGQQISLVILMDIATLDLTHYAVTSPFGIDTLTVYTLPSVPVDGQTYIIKNHSILFAGGVAVTDPTGSRIDNNMGGTAAFLIIPLGQSRRLIWSATESLWIQV